MWKVFWEPWRVSRENSRKPYLERSSVNENNNNLEEEMKKRYGLLLYMRGDILCLFILLYQSLWYDNLFNCNTIRSLWSQFRIHPHLEGIQELSCTYLQTCLRAYPFQGRATWAEWASLCPSHVQQSSKVDSFSLLLVVHLFSILNYLVTSLSSFFRWTVSTLVFSSEISWIM